jgi:hypothetical protein
MSENGVYPNMTIFMESMMNTSGGVPKWWVRFSRRLEKNHITSFKKGCIMQTNIPYPKELVEIILGGSGVPQKRSICDSRMC